ncbi:MAG: prepilin peptidase [Gemmataceae bacterium]|nr:prepilin peptidase [Gemmataceae bacterium]
MSDGVLWLGLAILLAATAYDVACRQVPDVFALLLLAWAGLATALGLHTVGWLALVGGLVIGLAAGLVGFALGVMGGGDVKALAALGAILGSSRCLPVLFWVALAGGVLGVIARLRGEREVAYLPAIAGGLLLFLILGGPLDALSL